MTDTPHMTLDEFEARYRDDGDPWGYETSEYERRKYDATLRACGDGPVGADGRARFHRALELGSSIGVLSARLAPRCESLITIDAAPTAVAAARRRLAAVDGVQLVLGAIPEAIPPGSYDLVLASEILYYLDEDALAATLSRLSRQTAPGARVVAVHWRPAGDERPFTAAEVHDRLRAQPWLASVSREDTEEYLLDVLERR